MSLPCVNRCNKSPVHGKCIYEWSESKQGARSTCPLCRGPLANVAYVPRDKIGSHRFHAFGARRDFLLRPVPERAGIVRCYVRAVRQGYQGTSTRYELYLQAPTTLKYPLGPLPSISAPKSGDVLLAVSHKHVNRWDCTQLDVTMDPAGRDFQLHSENYLGCVYSSFTGLEHTLVAPHRDASDGKLSMCELGAVRYTQNRIGRAVGPRRIHVCFPRVVRTIGVRENRPLALNHVVPFPGAAAAAAAQANGAKLTSPSSPAAGAMVPKQPARSGQPSPEQLVPAATTRNSSASAGQLQDLAWGVPLTPQLEGCPEWDDEDDDEDEGDLEDKQDPPVGAQILRLQGVPGAGLAPDLGSSARPATRSRAEGWSTIAYKPRRKHQSLSAILRNASQSSEPEPECTEEHLFGCNKTPYWLPAINAFSLDFGGRVTLPSNKNFQLMMNGNGSDITLQFGKVAESEDLEVFSMDVAWPLSPLQAFGVCLSACDRKLLCA